MESNTTGLIIFLVILVVLISFCLGYFFARTRAENRFLNAQTKLAKMKMDMIFKDKEQFDGKPQIKKIETKDLPPDFLGFLEELIEEDEKENNNGK